MLKMPCGKRRGEKGKGKEEEEYGKGQANEVNLHGASRGGQSNWNPKEKRNGVQGGGQGGSPEGEKVLH